MRVRPFLATVTTTAAVLSATLAGTPAAGAADVPVVKPDKKKVQCGQSSVRLLSGAVLRSPRLAHDEELDAAVVVSTYDEAVAYATGSWTAGEVLGRRTPGLDFYLTTARSKIDFRGNVYTIPAKTVFETRCYGRSKGSKSFYPALAAIPAAGSSVTVTVKTSAKAPGGFHNALLLANPKRFTSQRITLRLTQRRAIVRSAKTVTITPQVLSNRATAGTCFYPRAGWVDVKGRTKVLKK